MRVDHTGEMQALMDKLQKLPAEQIAEVEDFVDFLRMHRQHRASDNPPEKFSFPTISVGEWPNGLSLRREALYGDDER
ncbi:MAG TPA: hypothetical protein VK110_04065 [Salinisphaeraceae bacterium]|nr:hypothetical protein [Salinisphaeraceae bacterium]